MQRSCNLVLMHVVIVAINVIVIEMNCLQNLTFHFCKLFIIYIFQQQPQFESCAFPLFNLIPLYFNMGFQDGKILTLERKQVKPGSIVPVYYVIVL